MNRPKGIPVNSIIFRNLFPTLGPIPYLAELTLIFNSSLSAYGHYSISMDAEGCLSDSQIDIGLTSSVIVVEAPQGFCY